MNTVAEGLWPLSVELPLLSDTAAVLELQPGITTLVGPNGAGKTRALRAIKAALEAKAGIALSNRKIHFLAAGRSSPLENFRSAVQHPGHVETSDAAVGNIHFIGNWWQLESITGGLIALNERADLRLKVEASLQQLFDRSVRLSWSQNGLNVRIASTSGGAPYPANHEASGILQLVSLLAVIHNDQIGALLIDEPEISLHPQHQAFVLEEIEKVAGDLGDPLKKLVVIATHSASMLPLRRISELPAIVFFNSVYNPPAQVPADADILKRQKLGALVARLSTTHRMAMFAERILLVEGASDEIVATQLARRLNLRLLARNAQVLPVTGKGEFIEAEKLFRLMNKHVAVLADLDALADDNKLVCHFSELLAAKAIAASLGRAKLADLDGDLRNDLAAFMAKFPQAVETGVATYPYWSSEDSVALAPRRVTLARILSDPESFSAPAATEAANLRARYEALLNALAELGCFFLRRGAIETYYPAASKDRSKPDVAAVEAASFESKSVDELRVAYDDLIAPLLHIAPNQQVDEDRLLQPKLGAVLSATFLGMEADSSDERLNALANATIGSDAEVFHLSNASDGKDLRLRVEMASPLFAREGFPFEIGQEENPNLVVPKKLPGVGKG